MAANQSTETCTDCGTLIDVSREEPLALLHCPTCGAGLRVRKRFDHFEIQETLGAGGMGSVYRAKDTTLGRMVALKVLRSEYGKSPDFLRQFKTEAAATASINHPHVVKVYSSGESGGLLYIAMELVDQGSLEGQMGPARKIEELRVLEVGIQVAQGLEAALKNNLIHRDIKPGNILFDSKKQAKIVDFGLAGLADSGQKMGNEIWGTPYYVPPETLDHAKEDCRSDIYALGSTLYHALAGRPPFTGETVSIPELRELKRKFDPIEKVCPGVSSATAVAINKAIAFSPDDRHQNYDQLIQSLEFARKELAGKAKARTDNQQVSYQWLSLLTAAGIVLGGFVAPKLLFNRSKKPATSAPAPKPVTDPLKPSVESRFKTALETLLKNQPKEAALAFKELQTEADLPVPTEQWLLLHQALAHLLAQDNAGAETALGLLAERGKFSQHPDDAPLASFFVQIGRTVGTQGPLTPSQTRSFQYQDYRCFGLLLAGIKDWNQHKFEDAAKILENFHPTSVTTRPEWITSKETAETFSKIAQAKVSEFAAYREAALLLERAGDTATRRTAAAKAREALAALKSAPPLAEALIASAESAEALVKSAEEQESARQASMEAADLKELTEAKKQRLLALNKIQFQEALEAVRQTYLRTEKYRAERAAILAKTEYLIRFKRLLIQDISIAGSQRPIARRNGSPIPGTPAKADEQSIHSKTEYGTVPVAWADIHLESLYQVAQSLLKPGMPPESEAERRAALAAFASMIGKPAECKALLAEAVKLRPEIAKSVDPLLNFADQP